MIGWWGDATGEHRASARPRLAVASKAAEGSNHENANLGFVE